MNLLPPVKFCACLAALLLGACAGAPVDFGTADADVSKRLDQMGYSSKEPIRDIRNYRLNGWNYVDDYHLVIKSSPRVHYLVEFKNRCRDLRSAETVAFKTTVGTVSPGDKVFVRSPSGLIEDCWIDRLFELEQKPREDKQKD